MSNVEEKTVIAKPPPIGWVKRLCKECGVTRETVRFAIRYNQAGEKSELVRKKYKELFG